MTTEAPRFEELTDQQVKDRYWATKRLLRWWEADVAEFEEDSKLVVQILPSMTRRTDNAAIVRKDMMTNRFSQLRSDLDLLTKRLKGDPSSQELLDKEPERKSPDIETISISVEIDKSHPAYIGNFIGGELCSEEQMDEVIEALIGYLTDHPEPFEILSSKS